MTTQTWEAWIRPQLGRPGLVVEGVRQLTERPSTWSPVGQAPSYVTEYLWVRDGLLDPDELPTLDALRAIVPDGDLRHHDASGRLLDHILRFQVDARPIVPAAPPSVVRFDPDGATFVGDERDGCYYQVAEGPDGWYVTVVVDSDTGHFVMDLTTNDGPYDSEEHASQVGRDLCTTWCIDNGVSYDDACTECGDETSRTDGMCGACADADIIAE